MKILVTGGTSTIGKHLQQIMPQATYLSSKDCDLTNYEDTLKVFTEIKPDVVIHIAALVGGIQDNIARPVEYLEQNILLNTYTIKAAYEVGASRLIALASTCIYPDIMNSYPMKEEDIFTGPPALTNFNYAYSKRCMIAQIEAYNKQYGTKYCYITPSNLYSELDTHKKSRAHYVTALLDKIIAQEESGNKEVNLLGTGSPLRQFTYSGDIAKILYLMVEEGITESFNVANPENYTIDQLAKITLTSLNKTDWTISYSHPEMDGQQRRDVSIEKMLKIFPNFSFTKFGDGIKSSYIKKINK